MTDANSLLTPDSQYTLRELHLPPGVLFSEQEVDVLKALAAQHGLEDPDALAKAIRIVAWVGGYIYRPRGPPARHGGPLAGHCNSRRNVHRIYYGNGKQIMIITKRTDSQRQFRGKCRASKL